MKKKFRCLVIISAFFLFGSQITKAQQPEQVDVKSLTLTVEGTASDGRFSMSAVGSSQAAVNYAGAGSYLLPVFGCAPCNVPNIFSSNGFQRSGGGFRFAWGFDKLVYFYLSDVESSEIILRPTIRRKPQSFSINGTTRIRGRVEIKDNTNTVIAVDNDVVLEGGNSAKFNNLSSFGGRKIAFSKIVYALNQPSN